MRSGVRSPSAPPILSNSLNKLSGILDLDPDPFVIVPGSHDIQWTKSETYNDTKDVTAPQLAKKKFYREFFRARASSDG